VLRVVCVCVCLLKQYQFTNSNREQSNAYKNKPFIYQCINAYAYRFIEQKTSVCVCLSLTPHECYHGFRITETNTEREGEEEQDSGERRGKSCGNRKITDPMSLISLNYISDQGNVFATL